MFAIDRVREEGERYRGIGLSMDSPRTPQSWGLSRAAHDHVTRGGAGGSRSPARATAAGAINMPARAESAMVPYLVLTISAIYALEFKTGSEMDFGSGLVVSMSPSTGSTTRKNAK